MNKFSVIAICLCLFPLLNGCYQEGFPSVANITVVDEAGVPVAGANIKLYCDAQDCVVESEQTSDENGYARFEFPEPVVLRILATKGIPNEYLDTNGVLVQTMDSMKGEDWVIIPQHDETDKEVTMKM